MIRAVARPIFDCVGIFRAPLNYQDGSNANPSHHTVKTDLIPAAQGIVTEWPARGYQRVGEARSAE